MDLDHFRTILEKTGVDVWTFIDTAVLVASLDYGQELKQRRDGIVERLYASSVVNRCRNCDSGERPNGNEIVQRESNGRGSPATPRTDNDDEESDPYAGLFDGEQKSILEIKERLEDPDQSEDSLVSLLQSLADTDITFQALQETDIGRHVNQLRKHSSNEVRRLVKQLVRKWKETVQQWVSVNQPGELEPSQLIADADSPQQKIPQNGHLQVPDFGYSPNLQNGTSGLENNNILEPERNPKAAPPLQRDPPAKPARASPALLSVQRAREQKEQKESFDADRLASARKRLQDNYKEAENAKKQRTIRVMDIHELPKPKKAFFPKSKGSASQGRHW